MRRHSTHRLPHYCILGSHLRGLLVGFSGDFARDRACRSAPPGRLIRDQVPIASALEIGWRSLMSRILNEIGREITSSTNRSTTTINATINNIKLGAGRTGRAAQAQRRGHQLRGRWIGARVIGTRRRDWLQPSGVGATARNFGSLLTTPHLRAFQGPSSFLGTKVSPGGCKFFRHARPPVTVPFRVASRAGAPR